MSESLIERIKTEASGRWGAILSHVAQVPETILDGQHHACPKCGGKDRFRAFDDFDETGGLFCNQCFANKNADGISATAWLLGVDNANAIRRLADYLGIKKAESREPSESDRRLRDRIYRFVLEQLGKKPLHATHLQSLKRRGLTDVAIAGNQYVSIGGITADVVVGKKLECEIAKGFLEDFGISSFDEMAKIVPGFTRKANKQPKVPSSKAILIPVRNSEGLVVAIKRRLDDSCNKDGVQLPKYASFAASVKDREERRSLDGLEYPKAENAVHVPLHGELSTDVIRITEGELKADVATLLSGTLTISIPGANSWKRAIPVLKSLSAKKVLIALDADFRQNESVADALARLTRQCLSDGYQVRIESWSLEDGKGIDDLLAAGKTPTLIEQDAIESFLKAEADSVVSEARQKRLDASHGEDVDDPHRLARTFLIASFTVDGIQKLKRWRGEWHDWDGTHYRTLTGDEVRVGLTAHIKREFDRDYLATVAAMANKKDQEPPRTKKVTRALVANAIQALECLTSLADRIDQPSWLSNEPPIDPRHTLPTKNCLLDLNALVRGQAKMVAPTPLFFSSRAVAYEFDANAECPAWIEFLRSLWPKDKESAATLQEFFGYCLTSDTSLQKFLMLVGPPRSGKGTIGRVLKEVVGAANVASPTLSSLADRFGLWSLVGKSLAIIADARLSGRADVVAVVERLLSVIGEDPQDIDRKCLSPLAATHLPVKFLVMTNEVPSLTDASGAIVNRALILRMTRSFLGHEDRELQSRLSTELPGILNWSVAGWQRLNERGRFVQPETGQELIEEMSRQASPIGEFIEDCCDVGPDFSVASQELFGLWKKWCEQHGRDRASNEANFGKHLRAAVPSVNRHRPRSDISSRPYFYSGIGLKAGVVACMSGWS